MHKGPRALGRTLAWLSVLGQLSGFSAAQHSAYLFTNTWAFDDCRNSSVISQGLFCNELKSGTQERPTWCPRNYSKDCKWAPLLHQLTMDPNHAGDVVCGRILSLFWEFLQAFFLHLSHETPVSQLLPGRVVHTKQNCVLPHLRQSSGFDFMENPGTFTLLGCPVIALSGKFL